VSCSRLAALSWLSGAAVYLVCEGISAVGKPGYRYAVNYISDLGTSAVMNAGFMVHGLLFLLGALLVTRGQPALGGIGRSFVAAAAANAVGNILLGTFPSAAPGTVALHLSGAALAILGGNIAIIIAGAGGRRLGAPRGYARASAVLGVIGIACAVTLLVVPNGAIERGSVYPIILWELMTGVAILHWPGIQCAN
jgi:hypothetical membrane protein